MIAQNAAQQAADRIRDRRIALGTLGNVTREIATDLHATSDEGDQ